MSNKTRIWNYLITHGYTKAGAAGVLACIQGESAFDPMCCQGKSTSYRKTYTANVDRGKISKHTFSTSGGGYGLCQWTSSGRKANLYSYAKAKGTSIGDLNMQCSFIIHEMKSGYKSTYTLLTKTSSPEDAAQAVLLNFERPASINPSNPERRQKKINQLRARGRRIYNELKGNAVSDASSNTPTKSTYTAQSTYTPPSKTYDIDYKSMAVSSDDLSATIHLCRFGMRNRIYADGELVWSPEINDEEFAIYEPKLEIALNEAGSLEFTMPVTNRFYDKLQKLRTTIEIRATDDFISESLVWRGRVLDTTTQFSKAKKVHCEGELAFLNDSSISPYNYIRKPSVMFHYFIKKHNEQVSVNRSFSYFETDVKYDSKDDVLLQYENSDYQTAYDNIQSKLIDTCGGYLKALGGKITYTEKSGPKGSQVIRFQEGILELEEFVNGADIFTVLIPLGAMVPTTVINNEGAKEKQDKRRSIRTANGGSPFLENKAGIELYGRIVKTNIWDDIEDANTLKALGEKMLENAIEMATTITIKAIDLHLINVEVEEFELGYWYRVVSEPHGLDSYFQLTQISYDLGNPAANTYTFGKQFTALTDSIASSKKDITNNKYEIENVKISSSSGGSGYSYSPISNDDIDAICT